MELEEDGKQKSHSTYEYDSNGNLIRRVTYNANDTVYIDYINKSAALVVNNNTQETIQWDILWNVVYDEKGRITQKDADYYSTWNYGDYYIYLAE